MAEKVYLKLRIDGNEIEGESTVVSLDRADTIECSSFRIGAFVAIDAAGALTSKQQYEPIKIQKKIDKTTPLLIKALCNHETVNSAEFWFFRPTASGSGTEEHFYTVRINNGFISSVRQVSEDAIIAGPSAPPMLEEVEFVYQSITWKYESNGAEFRDSTPKR
jgi:type VI secretion system secreted protein Hcp